MGKDLTVTFASSLTDIRNINPSFDIGKLKICYTGDNRNKTSISREAIERALPTIYNCPVVCNYNRDDDTLGGHDVDVVSDAEGNLSMINLTTPVGCVPESSRPWFENSEDENGVVHEYLCTDVLLWKRQEAYKKIKNDGIVAESMEIRINDGEQRDGIYYIYDFCFTAFALIGVEPCFEGASLQMYSMGAFKAQLSEMMLELKDNIECINALLSGNDHTINYTTEGGEAVLDKNEILEKYGIDPETLDFSIDDYTAEELIEKFEAMLAEEQTVDEPTADENATEEEFNAADIDNPSDELPTQEEHEGDVAEESYELTSNLTDEIGTAMCAVVIDYPYGGSGPKYCICDTDFEAQEVYAWDVEDWNLYGFKYTIDGDKVTIDFESKMRKKIAIVDYVDGTQQSPLMAVIEYMDGKAKHESAEAENKYQEASATIEAMETELDELRNYKQDVEDRIEMENKNAVFARFEDLIGIEEFENVRENCADYDVETLEEKCFAIRGRNSVVKFSHEEKAPKLPVSRISVANEPYGGIFAEYGYTE